MAVGVDLHLDAAVAEDPLGDHRDHVHALHGRRDDEGRRFVIGIGGAGADRRDEVLRTGYDAAIPLAVAIEEGNHRIAARHGAIEDDVRIDPDQLSIVVRVTVAGARSSRIDVAEHGACVAADRVRLSELSMI